MSKYAVRCARVFGIGMREFEGVGVGFFVIRRVLGCSSEGVFFWVFM